MRLDNGAVVACVINTVDITGGSFTISYLMEEYSSIPYYIIYISPQQSKTVE